MWAHRGVIKPNLCYVLANVPSDIHVPKSTKQALAHEGWKITMKKEFDACSSQKSNLDTDTLFF